MPAVHGYKELEASEEEFSTGDEDVPPLQKLTVTETLDTVPECPNARPVVDNLRSQLAALGLDTRGRRQELAKRLRRAQKKKDAKIAPPDFKNDGNDFTCPWKFEGNDGPSWETQADGEVGKPKHHDGPQPYDYFCVIDVEATCEEGGDWEYSNEIIEFPVILIDGYTYEVLGEFHEYVRPVINPILSPFCKELTGITQEMVNTAHSFPVVLGNFERWLSHHTPYPHTNTLFICDGPWDIRDFIRKQCQTSILDRPPYLQRFIDLRRLYTDFYKRDRANLSGMLHGLDMRFEGREHCGLDDARNIARIVRRMMRDGCVMRENVELKLSKRKVGRKGRVLYTKGSNNDARWCQGMHIVI
ncbi:3'-5' exoribonuclease 1 [Rhizophlyctis rosea]|uniref:3'-5' exoribonuclease 1 n=1 Tax=Rhizophlyctis rosea TaxID=64517 RepID=A0AAD5SER8_9FUNG|nr:3'-5' exoribonuclease 1 [Rhizophlyctis rosea]